MMHQRHDEPVCLAAPSSQAPKPRSGAPKARGLTAKVRAKRSSALPWCRWFSSSCRSRKAFAKLNGKLAHGGRPFDSSPPAQAGILDREIQQLQRRIVGGKAAAGLDDLAQRAMQRLDRVGGVDHLADAGGEREERHDMVPGSSPRLGDRRIALAPFGLELLEPNQRHIGVLGPVNRLDGGQDRLAVLPGHERQAVPDQVHDAGLHDALRKHRRDRLGKAFEPVDDRDEDVVDATSFELVDHLEPEFGAFGLLDPKPENVLFAVWIERKRHVDGLVLDEAFVPDFDPQRVEKDHRIHRIKRPVLPFPDFIEYRIGDPADEVGRDFGSIELGQMALDLPHRHAAGVEAQNLVVEAVEPPLALGDQLRLEAARPVARHRKLDLAVLGEDRLRARAVAAVAAAAAGRITLLVTQVFGQLHSERALDQRPLELLKKPIFPRQVLGLLIVSKQLIQQFRCNRHVGRHVSLPSKVNSQKPAYTFFLTPSRKTPITAADLLNDRVLPFFEEHNAKLLRVLTDRGSEFCGNPERHEYELYLAVENIDHSRTKTKSPQTNGICERFHKTALNEFYRVAFRKKVYHSLDELQTDLDVWLREYNESRPHQGRWCFGKTPMQTFLDAMPMTKEKMIAA